MISLKDAKEFFADKPKPQEITLDMNAKMTEYETTWLYRYALWLTEKEHTKLDLTRGKFKPGDKFRAFQHTGAIKSEGALFKSFCLKYFVYTDNDKIKKQELITNAVIRMFGDYDIDDVQHVLKQAFIGATEHSIYDLENEMERRLGNIETIDAESENKRARKKVRRTKR